MKNTNKIILGTVQLGNKYGIYKKKKINLYQINKILNYASEKNISYLDTATSYGKSNYFIKKFLYLNKTKQFRIITKINKKDGHPEIQLKNIIKNIGKVPEIILCHSSKDYLNKNFYKKFLLLKKLGVKKLGVSIYSELEITKILKSNYLPDIIQLPINILDTRLVRSGILKKLKKKNIELHARSVFLQGLFFYKAEKINKIFPGIKKILSKIYELIKVDKINLPQASLMWVNSLKEIDKIIIGVKSKNELKVNLNYIRRRNFIFNKKFYLKIKFDNDKILNPSKWNKI